MPVRDDLLAQLTAALTQAKQEEQERERELDAAKRGFAEAREATRKLDRMLQNKPDGITKEQAHSCVTAVLQRTGPLPEQKLADEVTRALVQQQAPRKGLSLMLNLLRDEFADARGHWALPDQSEQSA